MIQPMAVMPALALLQDSLGHGSPPHIMLLDVMMPGLSG
jgi:DNA-binding response OmpR family regulator